MKAILFLPFFLILGCNAKKPIDKQALSQELDSIYQLDQKYRGEMQTVQQEFGWDSPEMKELWRKQNPIDSSNMLRIMEIIEEIGDYPGESMVGHSASKAAFYALQHAPDSIQEKYYKLIVKAAKDNQLDKNLAAMYQDRYLMHRGEPQIYGSQIVSTHKTNPETGGSFDSTYVWAIADTTKIDSVRLWNGMGPLEEYLNRFGLSRWK